MSYNGTTNEEWVEELSYCTLLFETSGDNNVGHSKEAVCSYIALQAKSARRCGFNQIADSLDQLLHKVRNS